MDKITFIIITLIALGIALTGGEVQEYLLFFTVGLQFLILSEIDDIKKNVSK